MLHVTHLVRRDASRVRSFVPPTIIMPPSTLNYADKIESILNRRKYANEIFLQSTMGMPSGGDAPPPAPPTATVPVVNNAAPALPTMTKAQLKMQQRFMLIHGINSDEDTVRIAAELEKQTADIQSREAPRTRAHRQRLKDLWELSVNLTKPSYAKIPKENLWLPDVVAQNIYQFLPLLVREISDDVIVV